MNSSISIPERVKQAVQSIVPDATVILFGSRARGDFHAESDWDFLVLTEQPVNWEVEKSIRNQIFYVELEVAQPISTIIENKAKWKML